MVHKETEHMKEKETTISSRRCELCGNELEIVDLKGDLVNAYYYCHRCDLENELLDIEHPYCPCTFCKNRRKEKADRNETKV